jgi:hypothetical protein
MQGPGWRPFSWIQRPQRKRLTQGLPEVCFKVPDCRQKEYRMRQSTTSNEIVKKFESLVDKLKGFTDEREVAKK